MRAGMGNPWRSLEPTMYSLGEAGWLGCRKGILINVTRPAAGSRVTSSDVARESWLSVVAQDVVAAGVSHVTARG